MFIVNILNKESGKAREVITCHRMTIPTRKEFESYAAQCQADHKDALTDKGLYCDEARAIQKSDSSCDYFLIAYHKDDNQIIPFNSSKYSIYAMSEQGKTIAQF